MASRSTKAYSPGPKSRKFEKLNCESNRTLKAKETEKVNFQLSKHRETQSNHQSDRISHRQSLHFERNSEQKCVQEQ
jgi:hypothetical protein